MDNSSIPLPPSEIPASSSPSGASNSTGKRLAKLTLWSPFAGIFLTGLFSDIFDLRGENQLKNSIIVFGIGSLFFAAGIAVGIKALRSMNLEGRKGIQVRALIGISLDGLLLAVMLCLIGWSVYLLNFQSKLKKHDEVEQQKVKEMTEVRDAATADFNLKVKNWETNLQAALLALKEANLTGSSVEANVLNMASVKSLEDIKNREKLMSNVIKASEAIKPVVEDAPALYDQELRKHNLPPRFREASVKVFAKLYFGKTTENSPAKLRISEAALKVFASQSNVLNFLDETWGQWTYLPATNMLEFQDQKRVAQYNAVFAEFSQAREELVKLRQGAQLQKTDQQEP